MRIPAILLLLTGFLLIAIARHQIRRARRLKIKNPATPTWRRRLTAWTLTLIGFLLILLGVTLW